MPNNPVSQTNLNRFPLPNYSSNPSVRHLLYPFAFGAALLNRYLWENQESEESLWPHIPNNRIPPNQLLIMS